MVFSLRNISIPRAILIIGILSTLLLAFYVSQIAYREDKLRLQRSAVVAENRIRDKISNYLALLRGGSAFFSAEEDVTPKEFVDYINRLQLGEYYTGIQGIGYAKRIEQTDIPRISAHVRANYYPDFSLRPSGTREVYFPIVYLEPLDKRNRAAVGYDMFSEDVRREAMQRAWTEGRSIASGKVTLVQEIEDEKQAGFLIYVPVFRDSNGKIPGSLEERLEKLDGFVYSPFRVGDLLDDIFTIAHKEGVDFSLYDGKYAQEESLMFAPPQSGNAKPRYTLRDEILVNGRAWLFVFSTNKNFPYSTQHIFVPYIMVLGLSISVILYMLSNAQTRARKEAENAVAALSKSQKSLKESNAKVTQILESITDGFFTLDRKWRFTYLNKEAIKVIGEPKQVLFNKKIWDHFPQLDKTSFGDMYKEAMKFKRAKVVEDYFEPHKAWYQVRVYPAKHGLSVFFQNISKRKELEQQKDEFLGIASHELKTPVTSIKAFGQVLEKKFVNMGDTAAAQTLGKMNKQVNRLSVLVNDLLDVSRIHSGKLQFREEKFNFSELVDDIVEEFQESTDKDIVVKNKNGSQKVFGDRERIGQVIANLLSNAIKYSPGTKKISISILRKPKELIFCIADKGIGIPKNEQSKLFGRFYRTTKAKKDNYGGIGLGLYISNEIITRHGGRMWVKSSVGKGSEFYFSLPL